MANLTMPAALPRKSKRMSTGCSVKPKCLLARSSSAKVYRTVSEIGSTLHFTDAGWELPKRSYLPTLLKSVPACNPNASCSPSFSIS